MPIPRCFPSSSIGLSVDIGPNFKDRPEYYSISWDDAFEFGSLRNDQSWFKVLHMCEPPEVLDVVERAIQIQDYYDLILTWNDKVLRECKNAKFLTESCCSWIDRRAGGSVKPCPGVGFEVNYEGCDVSKKRFEVSFLTSSKGRCPGHILRQEIYEKLPESVGGLKVWKHRSPPRIDDKRTMLEPVMFSIAPENSRHNGYYSEKLVDCFVAKAFPLYWGCPSLSRYFNPKGYMYFDSCEDLLKKLPLLTPDFYKERLPAIEENFAIALKSVHQWSIIEQRITEGIEEKHRKEGK